MANVLCKVRVRLDEESFLQVLKGVQSGEDIHSEVVDQRIILVITVQDDLLEAVRFGFELAHITVEMKHATWKESPAAQLAGGVGGRGEGGAGTRVPTEKCGNILLERLALVVQARNSTLVLGLEQRPTPPLTWRVRTVTSGGVGWGGFVHKGEERTFPGGAGMIKAFR
jgi:hypothetical protein